MYSSLVGRNDSRRYCILHLMVKRRLIMALSLALPVAGQNSTIHVTAPLVVLSASVTDRQAKSIDGLTAGDFVLLDESTRKPVNVDRSISDYHLSRS